MRNSHPPYKSPSGLSTMRHQSHAADTRSRIQKTSSYQNILTNNTSQTPTIPKPGRRRKHSSPRRPVQCNGHHLLGRNWPTERALPLLYRISPIEKDTSSWTNPERVRKNTGFRTKLLTAEDFWKYHTFYLTPWECHVPRLISAECPSWILSLWVQREEWPFTTHDTMLRSYYATAYMEMKILCVRSMFTPRL